MRNERFNRALLLALSGLFLYWLAACGDGGLQDARQAQLVVDPQEVTFLPRAVGDTDFRSVTVSNEGEGTLRIFDIETTGPDGVFTTTEVELPLDLEPGDVTTIGITYAPTAPVQSTGRLVFSSNGGGDDGKTSVELVGPEPGGRINVTPNPVDFGRVPGGEVATIQVEVANIGSSTLDLNDLLVVSGSGEFEFDANWQKPTPLTLAPVGQEGDRIFVPIVYSPDTDGFDTGNLIVESSDSQDATLRVPLQANGAEPCIAVSNEEGYQFGPRLLNQTHEQLFTITNCSDTTNGDELIVDSITWLNDAETTSSPTFGLTALPEFALTLAPGESSTFIVTYYPETEGPADRAVMRIRSNDDFKDPLDIEVTGIGSNNQPPTCVASCTVRGSGAPPSNDLAVIPLDVLDCTGSFSSDEDGEIAEYIWEVVERPDDSTATFDDDSAADTSFFVDLAGRFVFRLTVVDDDGTECTTPAEVVVVSTPDEDIHLQLVWHTPNDPDETNEGFAEGSDIDLHFLHPNGCWEDSTWDTHFRAPEPNWGNTARSDDDPSLDIDDTDGAGPENINLNNPESGTTYRVGVHYWNDHGWGPSTAIVRIYLFGVLVYQGEKLLEESDVFWEVASMEWPSGAVTVIDRLYPTIPDCP